MRVPDPIDYFLYSMLVTSLVFLLVSVVKILLTL